MSIHEVRHYDIEVPYPLRVWELFDDAKEFNMDFMAAVKNAEESGSDSFSGILWAKCSSWKEAKKIDSALTQLVIKYLIKAEEYDKAAEDE
jgi:predicted adenine nucleotide alpha hydrolase (AANH) superfamily ATPase